MKQAARLKDPHTEERQLYWRLLAAYLFMVLMLLLLVARFVWLQVFQYEHFTTLAQNNSISLVPVQPNRGLILDRNGIELARNYASYTLELTPDKIDNLDATIKALGEVVPITSRDLKRFQKFLSESKDFEPVPLRLKMDDTEAAKVAANLWRFPGVEVKARLYRDYPYKELTSHVLGYIGRIGPRDKDRLVAEEKAANYRGATHIGKLGLEAVYENELHGQNGFEEIETDSAGRAVRSLRRTAPVHGNTLQLALDIHLQDVADKLFGNRRGALVAIDPRSGGVLALLSKPSFDPNLFIDGIDSQSWQSLNDDWQRPLINRAIRGMYPPGSTFKPFMGMAALESGAIGPNEVRPAPGYFTLPGSSHQFRDSNPRGNGSANLARAIAVSSDTFFYKLAWDMGIDRIHPLLAQFGLGSKTGIDLDGEAIGVLPTKEWKARRFAGKRFRDEHRRWLPADVVSIGIGQGFNTYTPLQMANATAILANDGRAFHPHLVQKVTDALNGKTRLIEAAPYKQLPFKQQHYDYIKKGMQAVMQPGGTGWRLGQGLQYSMAGKTGTAQVVQIKQGAKYNAGALAEQHRDHSWFIAFAPVEQPKIAVAVIVENAGFGATAAAPIARALFDYYLTGKLSDDIRGQLETFPPSATGKQDASVAR